MELDRELDRLVCAFARVGVISHYIKTMIEDGTHISEVLHTMAEHGADEYHTDSDGVDLDPDTPSIEDIDQAASVQGDGNPADNDAPVDLPKPTKASKKRKRDNTADDACAKIRRKLAGGPVSVPNSVPRSTVTKQTTISSKPAFDPERSRLVEYGAHLERHIEQLAEYVIKCKWHPGTRGSETKIEGRFWGTQMSGANICKTLAVLLGPHPEPSKNVPYAGDVYRSLVIGAAVDPTAPDVFREAVNVIGDMAIRNMIAGAYKDGPNDIVAKIASAHKTDVEMAAREPKRLVQCLHAGVSTLITQQWGKATASWLD